MAFKRCTIEFNSLYNTCLAKHFSNSKFYFCSSFYEVSCSWNPKIKQTNPLLFSRFTGFGMQENSRRTQTRSHFADLEGRSTTMFVIGLVHWRPNLVRWLQWQHHPCMASVSLGISLRNARRSSIEHQSIASPIAPSSSGQLFYGSQTIP